MKNYVIVSILILITLIGISISAFSQDNDAVPTTKEKLCEFLSKNWGGVFIKYKGAEDFLNKCNEIEYDSEMELIQKIREIIADGHFNILLTSNHPESTAAYDKKKLIPLVLTEALNNETAIVQSTEGLRKIGLKEGNTILKINDKEVNYYLDKIMKHIPQSSIHETKEKAYRHLLSTFWKMYALPSYFNIPVFDGTNVDITFRDNETNIVKAVNVPFETAYRYKKNRFNFFNSTAGYYGSLQKDYEDKIKSCFGSMEYGALKEVDGKNWLIFHPYAMFFGEDPGTKAEDFKCYIDMIDEADYFVLDLRETLGGGYKSMDMILGLLGVESEFDIRAEIWEEGVLYTDDETFDYGEEYYYDYTIKPTLHENVTPVNKNIPIFIWTNSICGSACDLLLHSIKTRKLKENDNITIIGKPSAGRIIGVRRRYVDNIVIDVPDYIIYDKDGNVMEGQYVEPDIYFDVEAKDYQSVDSVFLKFVDFLKNNGLVSN